MLPQWITAFTELVLRYCCMQHVASVEYLLYRVGGTLPLSQDVELLVSGGALPPVLDCGVFDGHERRDALVTQPLRVHRGVLRAVEGLGGVNALHLPGELAALRWKGIYEQI